MKNTSADAAVDTDALKSLLIVNKNRHEIRILIFISIRSIETFGMQPSGCIWQNEMTKYSQTTGNVKFAARQTELGKVKSFMYTRNTVDENNKRIFTFR